jgi:hypothetical protein
MLLALYCHSLMIIQMSMFANTHRGYLKALRFITELPKKSLAVIWAIRQFRTYVHGVHFYVITDHNALVWLMSIRDPSGKLARWAIYLQSYDYEIKHRKGRVHSNVDTLSRPV